MEYFKAQQQHLKVIDEQEEKKAMQRQEKIMHEKTMRDQQLRKTEHTRRKETRENMAQEKETINRLLKEMEKDREIAI